jgi:hypothetical protein
LRRVFLDRANEVQSGDSCDLVSKSVLWPIGDIGNQDHWENA